MKYTSFRKRFVAILVLVLGAGMAVAQDTRGRVEGAVVDPSGSAVPGVAVTLQNDATGVTVTRSTGETYTITATQGGFSTVIQKNVIVRQRGDLTVDIALRLSDISQTITVEDSPVAVQFNTADRTVTVEGTLFKENPNMTVTSTEFGRTNAPAGGNVGRQLRYAIRVEF